MELTETLSILHQRRVQNFLVMKDIQWRFNRPPPFRPLPSLSAHGWILIGHYS